MNWSFCSIASAEWCTTVYRTLFTWLLVLRTHTDRPHTVCQSVQRHNTATYTHALSWESGSGDNTPLAEAAEKPASPSKSCQSCFMPKEHNRKGGSSSSLLIIPISHSYPHSLHTVPCVQQYSHSRFFLAIWGNSKRWMLWRLWCSEVLGSFLHTGKKQGLSVSCWDYVNFFSA